MPVCNQCQHKWSWTDTIKKIFRKRKICPYCGSVQFMTHKSSQKTIWYVLIIPFVFIVTSLFSLSTKVSLIVSTIVLIVGILTHPFLTELSNQEEFPE